MKKHIPNFLTCCNLLCGSVGILYILQWYDWPAEKTPQIASGFPPAYFVWAACVFDFFDGFAARALKVSSPIGKELDSLADVISFGLLPSVFMYKYLETTAGASADIMGYIPFVALLIVVCSALRLAIFNVDDTQHDSFKGLPTPANALFITGLPFLELPAFLGTHGNVWALVILTIVFSLLLVSRIDLLALKFKNFTWKANKIRLTFLILSVLLLVALQMAAIPLIIILYIALSLGAKALAKQTAEIR